MNLAWHGHVAGDVLYITRVLSRNGRRQSAVQSKRILTWIAVRDWSSRLISCRWYIRMDGQANSRFPPNQPAGSPAGATSSSGRWLGQPIICALFLFTPNLSQNQTASNWESRRWRHCNCIEPELDMEQARTRSRVRESLLPTNAAGTLNSGVDFAFGVKPWLICFTEIHSQSSRICAETHMCHKFFSINELMQKMPLLWQWWRCLKEFQVMAWTGWLFWSRCRVYCRHVLAARSKR